MGMGIAHGTAKCHDRETASQTKEALRMDNFRIHDEVLGEYESYVTSFMKTADERIRK